MIRFAVLLACLLAAKANAIHIDFLDLPQGTYTSIGDVTFSLVGEGEQGDPWVGRDWDSDRGGLWNSIDGDDYPTNTILRAEFDDLGSNVLFNFNNYGDEPSFWSIFDDEGTLIGTGELFTGIFDLAAYGSIKRIEWSHSYEYWYFAVESLTYDSVTAVPLPSSLGFLGLGLAGLAALRKKRKATSIV